MEWSGVEWSGVEWSGVEWSGVEWSGVEGNGFGWVQGVRGKDYMRPLIRVTKFNEKIKSNTNSMNFRYYGIQEAQQITRRKIE